MLPDPPPPPRMGVRKLLIAVFLGVCLGTSGTALYGLNPQPSLAQQLADVLAQGCVPIIQADDVPASVVEAYVNGLEANGARDIATATAEWKGTTIRVVTAAACNG